MNENNCQTTAIAFTLLNLYSSYSSLLMDIATCHHQHHYYQKKISLRGAIYKVNIQKDKNRNRVADSG